ncbi:MAG: hypothetical protein KGH54_00160 [Candidatus Micrarchaeota archaeon]|nr:hypothetical protein [Candidatus Micrarchaeota archaeon]
MADIEEKPVDLYIGCGDRRLNELFDSYEGNIIFIRNAAGNLKTLEKTIENKVRENVKRDGTSNIRKIKIFGHTDCGALGIALGNIMGIEQVSIQMREKLVTQYADFKVDYELSREENARRLEEFHVMKQKSNAKELLSRIHAATGIDTTKISIESALLQTHKHDKTEEQQNCNKGDYVAIVGDPIPIPNYLNIAAQANVNPYSMYCFNVDREECAGGLEIFAKLGVKVFLVTYQDENDLPQMSNRLIQVEEAIKSVRKDAQISPLKIDEIKGQLRTQKRTSEVKLRVV